MLSVHGNALFQSRLGVDVRAYVAALVKRLLTPFTSDKLRSHEGDIPGYAEAAPEEFLGLLEADLERPKPLLQELLKPVGPHFFDHPARSGILWALERLAWNPQTLMRVVLILARLSEKNIDDNWTNKPINSLSAIFRSWLPQTAAPLDDRIKALEALCQRFPDIRLADLHPAVRRTAADRFPKCTTALAERRGRGRLRGHPRGVGQVRSQIPRSCDLMADARQNDTQRSDRASRRHAGRERPFNGMEPH